MKEIKILISSNICFSVLTNGLNWKMCVCASKCSILTKGYLCVKQYSPLLLLTILNTAAVKILCMNFYTLTWYDGSS